ncbi:hypothetical protein R1sor_025206 [Riccia sorocarpa]|uniref:F-box domain-containing protein n=1 Tax=Riccia sorocarpa TaxID=122646 RepID=A0ABD3G7X4_9MARC
MKKTGTKSPRVACSRKRSRHPQAGSSKLQEMDPGIWSELPTDLVTKTLSHLPWWSNFKLRTTSKSWNDLLSDRRFLTECPHNDERTKPCFVCFSVRQIPGSEPEGSDSDINLVHRMCILGSSHYNPEGPPSLRSSLRNPQASVWKKYHAAEPGPSLLSTVRRLERSACCDASIWIAGKAHKEFAPVRGVFFGVVEVGENRVFIFINPFNATFTQLPPAPGLRLKCLQLDECARHAQIIPDDDPENVKFIFSHFAMEKWTLMVYDLVKHSWTVREGELAADLVDPSLRPTSTCILGSSIYVLMQSPPDDPNNISPRIFCITAGDSVIDCPVPNIAYSMPHVYIFRHRGHLMLARGFLTLRDSFLLDIWSLGPNKEQKNSEWKKQAVMPRALASKLGETVQSNIMSRWSSISCLVDGDFMCFRPTYRGTFLILLDLLQWRWELITTEDAYVEGFYLCQPRLDIVLASSTRRSKVSGVEQSSELYVTFSLGDHDQRRTYLHAAATVFGMRVQCHTVSVGIQHNNVRVKLCWN